MENTIPDPEQLAVSRAQCMTPFARAKRMILDKIMSNVIQAIRSANDKSGACLIELSPSEIYPLYDSFTYGEQTLLQSLYTHVKKLDTYIKADYILHTVTMEEAAAYIRAKLVAKSPLYCVALHNKRYDVMISWAQ